MRSKPILFRKQLRTSRCLLAMCELTSESLSDSDEGTSHVNLSNDLCLSSRATT